MPETGSPNGASVLAWLKQPGEEVEDEEPICLVAWDEVTAEVTSPAAGVMRMLALAPGNRAQTGGSLAIIDVGVGGLAAEQTPALDAPPIDPPPPLDPPPIEADTRPVPEDLHRDAPVAVPEHLLRDAPVAVPERRGLGGFLSPAVRHFVAEQGGDPREVEGTGRDGRVSLADLRGP